MTAPTCPQCGGPTATYEDLDRERYCLGWFDEECQWSEAIGGRHG